MDLMNLNSSVTLVIVLITGAISLLGFSQENLREKLLFWPARIKAKREYYRFLSHGLIHADLIHLTFNMLSLYSFGVFVEQDLFSSPTFFGKNGPVAYLILYVGALLFSGIPDYRRYQNTYEYRALGASGAVSAVIFAGILLRPTLPIRFLFLPFPIPGYIFALLFLGLSAYLAKRGQDNIGHTAHFFGALFGVLFTWLATTLFTDVNVFQDFFRAVF